MNRIENLGTLSLAERALSFISAFVGLAVTLSGGAGCTRASSPTSTTQSDAAASVARGKTIYMTSCIACHNADPSQPGALGPDLRGSSRDLIEARILRAAYPTGYQPKRSTQTMTALPHLKNEIESLTLFLNAPTSK